MDAEEHVEPHDEDVRAKITGSLTKVAVVSLNDVDDMIISRHYTGLGTEIKYIEVYLIRAHKYLGRFEVQEKSTFDVGWIHDSKFYDPPSEKDLAVYRKARITLLSALDKLWS